MNINEEPPQEEVHIEPLADNTRIPLQKKSHRKLFKTIITLIAILALYIVFEMYILTPPFSGTREVTIPLGTGLRSVASILKESGIIRSRGVFLLYTFLNIDESKIQAGHYTLRAMPVSLLEEELVKGEGRNDFTIPEGWTIKDIEAQLKKENMQSGEEFRAHAENTERFREKFHVLASIPSGVSLEGFLFPETYVISKTASADDVIVMILKNFDTELSAEFRRDISRQGKTVFQIITMASLIEKEVTSDEDRAIVSGILWKRLNIGIPLQVDATIAYIKKQRGTSSSNGKTFIADTKIDSPYNTYKYAGLPKGPIGNPGLSAIKAALYPKDSPYLYYLSTPEGKTIFSKTLEEHNKAKAKYLK